MPVSLFPVDYSVSSNEDIFEIIKYDIIDQLFEHYINEIDIQNNDFSNLLIAQSFIATKMDVFPVVNAFLKNTVLGAEAAITTIEKSKGLVSKFLDHKQMLNDSEAKHLTAFMEAIANQKGSIRESDGITILINDFLNRIRAKHEGKELVLILDDLDRLDPEQIFRLFNIFTAHHDSRKEVNKFGFDKIIFVCDIDNIENMFYHRFGMKANFDGYIDKFYSIKPFFFDHKQFLKEKARDYFINKLNLGSNIENFSEHSYLAGLYNEKSDFFDVMLQLSSKMIDSSILRTRNFQKLQSVSLPNHQLKLKHREQHVTMFPLIILCTMMQQLFPRVQDLILAVSALKESFEADYTVKAGTRAFIWENLLISYAIPFLIENLDEMEFRSGDRDQYYSLPVKNELKEDVRIVYQVVSEFRWEYRSFIFYKILNNTTRGEDISIAGAVSNPNPYHFLEMALKKCLKEGYIRS